MKIHEIINEDYYAAGDDLSLDGAFNPELASYNDKQRAAYDKTGPGTPVVKNIKYDQRKFTTKPVDSDIDQSPGYRGREYSKKRAGVPYHKNVQGAKYGFDRQVDPELDLISHQEPLGSPGINK